MAKSGTGKSSGKAGGNGPKSSKKGVPNTATAPYLDTFNKSSDCEQDKKNIADRCRDTPENKKEAKDSSKRTRATGKNAKLGNVMDHIKDGVQAMDKGAMALYGYKRDADNSWVEDHCDHLWVKPAGANISKFNEQLTGVKQKLEQGIQAVVNQAGGVIVDKAKDAAVNYGQKAIAREAAAATSLVVPVAGEVIVAGATLYNIADGVWTAGKTAYQAVGQAKEAYDKIKGIRDQLDKIQGLLDKKHSPTEVWADTMSALAYTNRCLQARRCQLVGFEETKADKQARSGKGCCPGQTGHHLLPEEMFQDCSEYTKEKHKQAPTVCVEGVNNSHGTHGIIHGKLEKFMEMHRQANPGNDSITKDEAIMYAVKSHTDTFKPACNSECLTAQLDSYYKKLCQTKMKPRGGKGIDIEEPSDKTATKTSTM